ncbi:MAG: alpha/beta hydrolase fold domain-containing protein [Planctomycetota bacterium]
MRFRLSPLTIVALLVACSGLGARGQDTARQRQAGNITKEQRIKNWLRMQDKNADGRIAQDEATGLMKSNFARNDANKDSFLDRDELGALADRLARGGSGRNRRPRNRQTVTTEQMLAQAPEGVTVIPDIAYREGNDAWKLDLAMPTNRGDKPRPAIVFVHGGGWVSGDKRAGNFLRPTLEFAAKGYVCITINYRLGGPKRDCVEDAKCSVRWLRAHAKKYNVDPGRIGAYGNSAGAHLVTMLGTCPASAGLEGDGPWRQYSSMVQAVVASATPTRPRVRGGSQDDAKKIAPMTYATADAPPLLLVHEESDRTVPVSNSDDFVKALRDAGAKDVTYMRYTDGSGHGTFMANIKETGPAREKFFARTLKKRRSKYVFTVRDGKTYLNDKKILVKGLRCSNALVSDESADELIANLDAFASYGVNTVSVFFMGSRFGDVKGYDEYGNLNPVYAARMARIIEAADQRGMIVLVGCLYWGNSKAKWDNWTQTEANAAVANTVRWLKESDYRNVFVDVDNEGMAKRGKGFDNRLMVIAGKKVDPDCVIATNFHGPPPAEADLGIHFSKKVEGKPYIESEGTPTNAPGKYWGKYSKKPDYYNYINIGLYNDQMKANQIAITGEHLDNGRGYMCASTWLQCPPASGPNNRPGGDGTKDSPGIRWWLEFIRDKYGAYVPPEPAPGTTP